MKRIHLQRYLCVVFSMWFARFPHSRCSLQLKLKAIFIEDGWEFRSVIFYDLSLYVVSISSIHVAHSTQLVDIECLLFAVFCSVYFFLFGKQNFRKCIELVSSVVAKLPRQWPRDSSKRVGQYLSK